MSLSVLSTSAIFRDAIACAGAGPAQDVEGDADFRAAAKDRYYDEGTLEVAENAAVSRRPDGAYVSAWVWVEACELCKRALPMSGDCWSGLCPGCADRVSDLMDTSEIDRDVAVERLRAGLSNLCSTR